MTVILNWNSLPADAVNAKTVNGFKNTLTEIPETDMLAGPTSNK